MAHGRRCKSPYVAVFLDPRPASLPPPDEKLSTETKTRLPTIMPQNRQPAHHLGFSSPFHGCPLRPLLFPSTSTLAPLQHLPFVFTATTKCRIASTEASANSTSDESAWRPGRIRAPRPSYGAGRRRRGKVRIQGKYYRTPAPPPVAPGLRITNGTAGGRRILSPNVYLRPMMGKVREALFSILEVFEVVREDGCVLDLFAGSGSIGIESMSRGMGNGVFVDSSEECTEVMRENLRRCEMEERGKVFCGKVEDFLRAGGKEWNEGRSYDLITLTPPYEEVDYGKLMEAVASSDCVGEGTFVVIEYPVELGVMPPAIGHRLVGVRNRRYGRTVLAVYACQPRGDVDLRGDEFVTLNGKK